MPVIPELVGSAEAAKLLEIGPTNFSHLRRKMEVAGDDSFPEPVAKLQCGPIWTRKSMDSFKKHYDSRRRRVRSTNGDNAAVETPAPTKAKATKATATKTAAKPRKATAKGPSAASVTDIKAKRTPRLKVKSSA